MIDIITALGNPILNIELNKINNINVLLNDLQYKEAILEFLEKNIKIDYLIISQSLPGEIELNKLIDIFKIKNKNAKIILIKERKLDKQNNINEIKNVDYIFYNNEVEIKNIIEIINNKKIISDDKIKKDIEIIKNKLINKNNKKIKSKEKININNKVKNKIITILGATGSGKSVFSVVFSKILENKGEKILIIDFDIFNNNIHTIFGIKKYNKNIKINNKNIFNNYLININKNIDLITGLDLLFKINKKINSEEIIHNIKKLKNYYNYIIIDTSSKYFLEYSKELINISDISIFVAEANLLEIKKARKLLDIYEKDFKIKKDKIKIIINKYNKNCIKDNILIKLFNEQEILGKIKLYNYYDYLINKNYILNLQNNKIKNEYLKIIKKLKLEKSEIKLNNKIIKIYKEIKNIFLELK